jgi:rfaE bifunctional protein kinase chain/domain
MERLETILRDISRLRVVVLGDIGIDIYWHADMKLSELSRETPHFPLPVIDERISLGAGGNVVANVCALGAQSVSVISAIGQDWRGTLLRQELDKLHVQTEALITQPQRMTFAYGKPIRKGISSVTCEDPRLDFINTEPISVDRENKLIEALQAASDNADVLLVSDQFSFGCVTERVRQEVCSIGKSGMPIVADSRNNIALYKNIIIKPNEVEGIQALGMQCTGMELEHYRTVAMQLAKKCESRVLMTLGDRGSIYADGMVWEYNVPWNIDGELDIVGAGDTFMSGFGCAFAAGASYGEAADFASLCSAVTIAKLGVTGTAAPHEILRTYETLSSKEE